MEVSCRKLRADSLKLAVGKFAAPVLPIIVIISQYLLDVKTFLIRLTASKVQKLLVEHVSNIVTKVSSLWVLNLRHFLLALSLKYGKNLVSFLLSFDLAL